MTRVHHAHTGMCFVFAWLFFLQTVIEQLEEERRAMADTIAERTREHQQLLQVKMDLGVEVSAYR